MRKKLTITVKGTVVKFDIGFRVLDEDDEFINLLANELGYMQPQRSSDSWHNYFDNILELKTFTVEFIKHPTEFKDETMEDFIGIFCNSLLEGLKDEKLDKFYKILIKGIDLSK
jgi:hypothetical protein